MPKSNHATSRRFVLGLDFGTLSVRALLVDAQDGSEKASVVSNYAHGCMDRELFGKKLKHDSALQNPQDYLQSLKAVVPRALREAGVKGDRVVGIGVDFTSCTVLPTKHNGTPLCSLKRWQSNPHAWVKLWKHHAAQPEADAINALGAKRGESFLKTYGGKYSSEWFFSKLLELVREAPAVYEAADRFLEAGDWLVWQLCARERRCLSAAGFKGMRVQGTADTGWDFPDQDFFKSLHPRLENVVDEKIGREFIGLGECAGGLTADWARQLGLVKGTPIAAANIDAHAAVPACTVTTPRKLVMILGTSTCHLMLDETQREIEGMCGVVQDGVIPGYWGYEAGQSGVGDMFAWFVDRAVPCSVEQQARKHGRTLYEELADEARQLKPGASGLLALDWWNGNRSVLVDADLSGVLVGITLATRPAEIYRSLLEATAFGTQKIIEAFTNQGIKIDELYACGGLAHKNPLMMQIYADVTGRPIRIAASEQASALGAAMFGAVAAGLYPTIKEATKKMARLSKKIYRPNQANHLLYQSLYAIYSRLHDQFGRDVNGVLKELRRLRG